MNGAPPIAAASGESQPASPAVVAGSPATPPSEDDFSRLFPPSGDESNRALEAFRVYLELGPSRRYLTVGRKVGVSLRTIKRWARAFDWRGRIRNYTAQCGGRFLQTGAAAQREESLDAVARTRTFREWQYALAEALFSAAERYLERVDDDDLDQLNLADVCKALVVAGQLGQQAAGRREKRLRRSAACGISWRHCSIRPTAKLPTATATATVLRREEFLPASAFNHEDVYADPPLEGLFPVALVRGPLGWCQSGTKRAKPRQLGPPTTSNHY